MKLLLLFFLPFFEPAAPDSGGVKMDWLPTSKMVQTFTADSRANRLSFQRNFDEASYTASMGGIFPFINIGKGKFKSQLSVAGSTYLTLARQNGAGSVKNVDFFGELYYDIRLGEKHILRAGTGHSSQHLSDDAIVAGAAFKNYAKDYHQLMYIARLPEKGLQAYMGIHYIYNFKTSTDISGKWMGQLGFEHAPFVGHKYLGGIYWGVDAKWRQELDYGSTFNAQLGYKLMPANGRAFRLALDYTKGIDERGYYQPSKRDFAHLGIYFDF